MGTPNSSSTAYAAGADLVIRYDPRTIGELVSDTNTAVTAGAVPSDPVVGTLLLEASGMVEMACTVGNRYSPADLAGLTGASLAMLKGLVCGLTMYLLWCRRPARHKEMELPSNAVLAMDMLDKVREGERVFGILEVAQAGNVSDPQFLTPTDLRVRNSVSVQARPFFGDRAQFQAGGG